MIFYDFLVYWCLLFNSITTNNQVPVGRTLIRLWSIHLVHGVIPSWRGVAHWQLKKGLEVHSLTANQRWKLTYIRNHQNISEHIRTYQNHLCQRWHKTFDWKRHEATELTVSWDLGMVWHHSEQRSFVRNWCLGWINIKVQCGSIQLKGLVDVKGHLTSSN